MKIFCNSLERIKDSLGKSVQLTAQSKGILPKEALLFHDIVIPDSILNSWDAVDLISHCSCKDKEVIAHG